MTKFSVPKMSCGHCKASIEKSVTEADDFAELTFDMEAREVEIDSELDTDALIAAIKDGGFEASAIG